MFSITNCKCVVFHCYLWWAENKCVYGFGHANESGNKYRESRMGDKYGKTCHADKQTIAVTTTGLDTTEVVLCKQHQLAEI